MATAKQNDSISEINAAIEITEEDFKEFLSATREEQWKILLNHTEKNRIKVISKNNTGEDK